MTDEQQALVNLYKLIDDIFDGITRKSDDFNGWWDTDEGVKFGKTKMNEVRTLLLGSYDG